MKRIVWMSVCILLLLAIPAAVIGMPVGDQNATMGPGNETGNVTGNVTGNMTANMTVVDVINQNENLSTLATMIQVANLTETLNGTGPFTVFAPDNMAFDALGNQTVNQLMNNTTMLSEILQYHVVQGTYTTADLMNMTQNMTQAGNATQNMTQNATQNATQNMTQNMTQNATQNATQNMTMLQTLSGQNLTVTVQNGTLMIDNATIVTPDLNASNGVVQIIDMVLIPPGVNITAQAQNQTQNMTQAGNQTQNMTGNQSSTSPQSQY
jgi:uncharacterized surface protein with fasciclin (FAS1) repeats